MTREGGGERRRGEEGVERRRGEEGRKTM